MAGGEHEDAGAVWGFHTTAAARIGADGLGMGGEPADGGAYDAGDDEGWGDDEDCVDAYEFSVCFAEQREFERAGLEECDGTDGAWVGAGGGGCGDGCGGEVF